MYKLKKHKYTASLTLAMFILVLVTVSVPQPVLGAWVPGGPSAENIQPVSVTVTDRNNPCNHGDSTYSVYEGDSDITSSWCNADFVTGSSGENVSYYVYANVGTTHYFLDWEYSSASMYVHAVYIKGVLNNNYNVYYYPSTIKSDKGLHAFYENAMSYYDQIEEIIFCLLPIPDPDIEITKEVKLASDAVYGSSCSAATGQPVDYRIVVTNTGNVDLSNITISDPMLTITESLGSLAAGASRTITRQHSFAAAGTQVNTATVTGDYQQTKLTDSASATVTISAPAVNPGLGITKEVKQAGSSDAAYSSSCSAATGQQVYYRITVINSGDVDLSNITISDPMLSITESLGSLAAGASHAMTRQHSFAAAGTYENTAAVTGYYQQDAFTDNASATVNVSSTGGGGGSNGRDRPTRVKTEDQSGGQADKEKTRIDSLPTETEPPVVEKPVQELQNPSEEVPELPKTGTAGMIYGSIGLVLIGGGLVCNRMYRKRNH